MLTLYGCSSPNVLKVIIALEELSLPFAYVEIDPIRGDQYTSAFTSLSPNGKVPVLDDDVPDALGPIWESGAILLYLAETHGRFLPTQRGERYLTLQWMMFQMAGIGPMFGQLSHFRNYAPEPENNYARARYATEVKRLYDVVEARLTVSAYVAGEDYSIADMAVWPWMRNFDARGVDPATVPATARWIESVGARPAVRKAVAFMDPLAKADISRMIEDHPDEFDRYLGRGQYSRG